MKNSKVTPLIVLEHHFIKDKNNNIWCKRVINNKYLSRYLKVFSKIIVCARFDYEDEIKNNNYNLIDCKNVTFIELPEFVGLKGIIKNYFKIKAAIKNNIDKFDCVIMRAPTHLSLLTYKIFLKNKKPYALEFIGGANMMLSDESIINKLLNKLVDKKYKKICLKANGVAYVTKEILQKEYPCKALKYKNDLRYFTTSYSSINLEDKDYYVQNWKSNKKPEKFIISHTGYMDTNKKGHDTLIYVAKKLVDLNIKNFQINFVGDGAKFEEYKSLVHELNLDEYINFCGSKNCKEEVLSILRQSHLFILPSHVEGLPRSIIEAMACSLPCIASPVNGIPELLDSKFLIDYNNIDGYVNSIIYLFNNWDVMIQEGIKNYNKSLLFKNDLLEIKRIDFYKKLYELVKEN